MFSVTCAGSDWEMVIQKPSLKGEDSGCEPSSPLPHHCPSSDGCFPRSQGREILEQSGLHGVLISCQFPECFSHFSPCHSDAFVSLLPGNKQRGRDRSGSALCPGTSFGWSLPNGVKPACPFSQAPQILQQPYRGGRSALFIGVQCEQAPDHGNIPALGHRPCAWWLWWESNDLYLQRSAIFPFNPSTYPSPPLAANNQCGGRSKNFFSFGTVARSHHYSKSTVSILQQYPHFGWMKTFSPSKRFFEVVFSGWISQQRVQETTLVLCPGPPVIQGSSPHYSLKSTVRSHFKRAQL